MENNPVSVNEQRIRKITSLYYSRPEIQKAIFEFSKNREICPRYFEGFGKRPDSFEYSGDIFELVKKGATSFHCSEELWRDPLKIQTGMNEKQINELRIGWDFLLDIDSKYIDYSRIMAIEILKVLKFHGVKNVGIKFSVSGDTPVLIKEDKDISLFSIAEVIEKLREHRKLEILSVGKDRKLKFSKIYGFLEHKDTLYEVNHSQSTIPLKATGHHSVFVWSKGEIIQKKVTELKKGDFLISYNSKENPFSQKNLIVTNNFEFSRNQHSKKLISNNIKITKELMRLIGYFLAEGHVTNIINQVGFTFNQKEIEYIEDVKFLLNSITGRKISIRHPNSGSTQILIHSKEWANFFDTFCGKKKEKHVPSFAFKSPRELFTELLRGYIRGDGYKIGEYGIVVKSVSKRLITEFIWLCKLNNISCNISFEQNKEHKLPQGTTFKGSLVYLLRIPKSELEIIEFNRQRNKFSPYAGDKIFPVDGLREIYKQIKPKMFNSHRAEQMTLSKRNANLQRIKRVLDWFNKFKENEYDKNSRIILENYKNLFNSDISVVEVEKIVEKNRERVYDVSVEETESFFGNYYPILLHNSGSKGFHLIIPWKAFPKEINGVKTSEKFPEWPRILIKYLMEQTKDKLIEKISGLERPNKYIKDYKAPKEVMPDLILVSPRHLFRMPYSLHEKTALASIVLKSEELEKFDMKNANPMKLSSLEIGDFFPNSKEGEASEFLVQALDWYKEDNKDEVKEEKDFKPIKLTNLSDTHFSPCIKNILKGISDGRKRALFILINLFRTIGIDRDELEKRIYDWNKKNESSLQEGYIKNQISWAYRKKPIMPPNCKEFYSGIGMCEPDSFCRIIKNPASYVIKKSLRADKK
ncbi:MAG: LAGLIDADG family homing endonuclease [Candidatus Diapherotrites archaeon]